MRAETPEKSGAGWSNAAASRTCCSASVATASISARISSNWTITVSVLVLLLPARRLSTLPYAYAKHALNKRYRAPSHWVHTTERKGACSLKLSCSVRKYQSSVYDTAGSGRERTTGLDLHPLAADSLHALQEPRHVAVHLLCQLALLHVQLLLELSQAG